MLLLQPVKISSFLRSSPNRLWSVSSSQECYLMKMETVSCQLHLDDSLFTSAGMRLLESCGWILHERLLMTVPTWMYHPITSLKLMTLRLSPTSTIIFYFYWWGWKDCHDMFRAWRSRPLEKKPGMLEVPWLAVTRLIMIREYTVNLLLLVLWWPLGRRLLIRKPIRPWAPFLLFHSCSSPRHIKA